MHTIEVDFDVFKQLTVRRPTESVSYNDVIRELLGLSQQQESEVKGSIDSSSNDWIVKGVRFPSGTRFQANYKGQLWTGRVESGALVVTGKRYDSPSAAAVAITGSAVNGWRFWKCLLPGKTTWILLESLRK